MKTILHNIKTSTADFHPVGRVATYLVLGIIATGAIALIAGVLISGAPTTF